MKIKFTKRFVINLLPISCMVLVLLLNSCLMNYPTYDSSAATKPSKETTIQNNISSYVTTKYAEIGTYKSVQYGKLRVTKPNDIKELDSLITFRNELPLMEAKYGSKLDSALKNQDALIEIKKQEIKKSNSYPLYEISHLFTISVSSELIQVYEFDFSLFPNYTVKDVNQLLFTELTAAEYKLFLHLTNQYTLFVGYPDVDATFYTKFFTALENETNYKPQLLKNILNIIDFILKNKRFDEHQFCQQEAKKWVASNPDFNESKPEGFSKNELIMVYTVDANDTKILTGYNLVYLFTYIENGKKIQKKLSFDFDLNYLLIRVKETN